MFSRFRSLALLLATAFAAGACSDSTAPTTARPDLTAVKFWEAGSSVAWNRTALELFRARGGGLNRITAYLSLAQYRAVLAANAASKGMVHPSPAGAAAGASVVVLSQFYPEDAAALEARLASQRALPSWPGEQHTDFAAGEAIGREVGAAALALAATDGYGATSPGDPPVGPGFWTSSGEPIISVPLGARPFFLASGDELRLPPPPAFGSSEYLAALAEVRAVSDGRTPEQLAIARKWVPFSGLIMNGVATDLIVKHHRSELEAARILAYANTAAFDAIIACWDTKFTYWFIRPSQADPAITLPVGLPNHPSYPSAHNCETGAHEAILADAFPSERPFLGALAAEASVSRLYAGLHYRFDNEGGLAIGHGAARLALQRKGIE